MSVSLLSMACLACFHRQCRTTVPGAEPHSGLGPATLIINQGFFLIDLLIVQGDEGIFSVEVSFCVMTMALVKLKSKTTK